MKRLIRLLVVGLLAYAFQATAQDILVQAPEPAAGLVLKFCRTSYNGYNALCYTREFLEQRGSELIYLVQEDGSQEKRELIMIYEKPYLGLKVRPMQGLNTYEPHSFSLKFPLRVGVSWSGVWNQTNAQTTLSRSREARVVGYGDVTVKAGTFKAFEILSNNQRRGARNPAREQYFYSPELGTNIKYESIEFDMREELVEVRRMPVKTVSKK